MQIFLRISSTSSLSYWDHLKKGHIWNCLHFPKFLFITILPKKHFDMCGSRHMYRQYRTSHHFKTDWIKHEGTWYKNHASNGKFLFFLKCLKLQNILKRYSGDHHLPFQNKFLVPRSYLLSQLQYLFLYFSRICLIQNYVLQRKLTTNLHHCDEGFLLTWKKVL